MPFIGISARSCESNCRLWIIPQDEHHQGITNDNCACDGQWIAKWKDPPGCAPLGWIWRLARMALRIISSDNCCLGCVMHLCHPLNGGIINLEWTTASWRARLPTSSPKLASLICDVAVLALWALRAVPSLWWVCSWKHCSLDHMRIRNRGTHVLVPTDLSLRCFHKQNTFEWCSWDLLWSAFDQHFEPCTKAWIWT